MLDSIISRHWSIVVLLFVLNISCNSENNIIKIGVIFPMTGDAASYGEKGEKAIQLAVQEINEHGGINGRRIEAIIEDSKAEPKTGVSAVQKLVATDKVVAIVGDIVSSVTLAIAPICEKNQVILIAPTSSAPAITDAGEFIYRVWPSDLSEGEAVGQFAKEQGYMRAAIFHLNNDYGISISEIFSKNFQGDSTQVILTEAYSQDQTDFKPMITKIKNKNPDVVYVAGYYGDVARILKQSKELSFEVQFLGVTAIEDEEFLRIAGEASEGIIYPLASGFNINSDNSSSNKFIQNFESKYGYKPGWVEAHCYDALMVIVESLRNSNGTYSGEDIRAYINQTKKFDGVTGTIIFDENGDVIKPIVFKQVRNGEFVNIY